MKKATTLVFVLICALNIQAGVGPNAQTAQPGQVQQPVQPLKSFHQAILQQSGQPIVHPLQNSGISPDQRSYSYTYKEIGFRHDAYNDGVSAFVPIDSGTYTYDGSFNETGELQYTYSTPTWLNNKRNSYTYDGSGNLTSDTIYTWADSLWRYSTVATYTYTGGNETGFQEANWDTVRGKWFYTNGYTFAYNGNGSQTLELYQHYDTVKDQWVNQWQYLYSFNADNDDTITTYQTWDTTHTPAAWLNSYKYTYTYKSAGNRNGYLYQKWDTLHGPAAWLNTSGDTIIFTDKNNRDSIVSYHQWDTTAKNWVNTYQYLYTYNGVLGNLSNETEYSWDTGDHKFDNNYFIVNYNYDAEGHETGYATQNWNAVLSLYTNNAKQVYTYDAKNHLITTELDLGLNDSLWAPHTKDSAAYDAYGDQVYYEYQNYSNGTMSFNAYDRTFYYFERLTGIEEVKNDIKVTLYPNPTAGEVNLSLSLEKPAPVMMNVYDLNGRIVISETRNLNEGPNRLTIGATEIAAGFYTVQLVNLDTKESSVLKLVKQ